MWKKYVRFSWEEPSSPISGNNREGGRLCASLCVLLLAGTLLVAPTARSSDLFFGTSAYVGGPGGSLYVHEVEVLNPTASPASFDLQWLPRGADNSIPTVVTLIVDPSRATRFENILNAAFGVEPDAAGALRVTSSVSDLKFHSRFFNVLGGQTFGQVVPAVPATNGFGPGEQAFIIHLSENDDYRSNVGCVNTLSAYVTVDIDLLTSSGLFLERRTMNLAPWSNNQLNRLFRDYSPATGVLRLSTATPGGRAICHGTVLNNQTSDPRFEPATKANDIHYEYYLPIAFNTSESSSDLSLYSPWGDVTAEIDLLRTGFDNTSHESHSVLVPGGQEVRLDDVLATTFNHDGTAALRVSVTNGPPLHVSTQTSNSSPNGMTIRYVPPSPLSDHIQYGDSAVVFHLKETGTFRTDIGFLNTSAVAIDLLLDVHGELGSLLGSVPIRVLPFGHYQLNSVFAAVGHPLVPVGFAIAYTATPGGSFLAYATVTDLSTRDAYHVTANRLFVSVFSDGFESGDTSAWSATVP